MNNNSILLIDPTFDPVTAPACNLLVKVGLDSISYAIINEGSKRVIAVFDVQECEDVAQDLAERLKTDSYLALPYREVKLAIDTPNTVSVPKDLFDQDNLAVYAQFFPEPYAGSLYAQVQKHFGFITVFAFPVSMGETLNVFTGSKKFQPNAGLLLFATYVDHDTIILDFTITSFNIVFIRDRQLVFQQRYEIENTEEFNYYLLLIIKQLNINTENTNLQLSGIIHKGDEKYNCILKYFGEPTFKTIGDELDQEILDDMPLHYYSNLLALDQCV